MQTRDQLVGCACVTTTRRRPQRRKCKCSSGRRSKRALFFESLEERRVLTTDVSADDAPGEGGQGQFTFTTDETEAVEIQYVVNGVSAIPIGLTRNSTPADHTLGTSGTIVIPENEHMVALYYTAIDDGFYEGTEGLSLTIVSVSIGDIGQATADSHISDNDPQVDPKPILPGCFECPDAAGPGLVGASPVGPIAQIGVTTSGGSGGLSSNPVRYSDGTVIIASTDLSSDLAGIPWGVNRQWTNNRAYIRSNGVGEGMVMTEQPTLIQLQESDDLAVIANGHTAYIFEWDAVAEVYLPQGFLRESLTYDGVNDEYVLTDTSGAKLRFFGFTNPAPPRLSGSRQGLVTGNW